MVAISESTPGLPLEVRRDRIAGAIAERGHLRVSDLADQFHVSEVTVRSDLADLERRAQVRRVRGGAVAVPSRQDERP